MSEDPPHAPILWASWVVAMCLIAQSAQPETAAPAQLGTFRKLQFGQPIKKQISECPRKPAVAGSEVRVYISKPKTTCWVNGCNVLPCQNGSPLKTPVAVEFADDVPLDWLWLNEVDGKLAALHVHFEDPSKIFAELEPLFGQKYGTPAQSEDREVTLTMGNVVTQRDRQWHWQGLIIGLIVPYGDVLHGWLFVVTEEYSRSIANDAEKQRRKNLGDL